MARVQGADLDGDQLRNKRFGTIIDSGLFHVLSDEDRVRYVAGLTHVAQPGGQMLLLCFSDEEPGAQGPRRVTQREIRAAFDDAWTVEEIRARRADVRPDLEGLSFSEGAESVVCDHSRGTVCKAQAGRLLRATRATPRGAETASPFLKPGG